MKTLFIIRRRGNVCLRRHGGNLNVELPADARPRQRRPLAFSPALVSHWSSSISAASSHAGPPPPRYRPPPKGQIKVEFFPTEIIAGIPGKKRRSRPPAAAQLLQPRTSINAMKHILQHNTAHKMKACHPLVQVLLNQEPASRGLRPGSEGSVVPGRVKQEPVPRGHVGAFSAKMVKSCDSDAN